MVLWTLVVCFWLVVWLDVFRFWCFVVWFFEWNCFSDCCLGLVDTWLLFGCLWLNMLFSLGPVCRFALQFGFLVDCLMLVGYCCLLLDYVGFPGLALVVALYFCCFVMPGLGVVWFSMLGFELWCFRFVLSWFGVWLCVTCVLFLVSWACLDYGFTCVYCVWYFWSRFLFVSWEFVCWCLVFWFVWSVFAVDGGVWFGCLFCLLVVFCRVKLAPLI